MSKIERAKVKLQDQDKEGERQRQEKSATSTSRDNVFLGVHSLRPAPGSREKKKLLGRGPSSGHGKTSTRGSKGQTSRAGRDYYLGFEGGQTPLIRRMPKRGFTNVSKIEYQLVKIKDIARLNESNVTLELLQKRSLIKDLERPVKILADGEISSVVVVQAHACSKAAEDKIRAAGGKVELVCFKR